MIQVKIVELTEQENQKFLEEKDRKLNKEIENIKQKQEIVNGTNRFVGYWDIYMLKTKTNFKAQEIKIVLKNYKKLHSSKPFNLAVLDKFSIFLK